jgi:hypothetical protein
MNLFRKYFLCCLFFILISVCGYAAHDSTKVDSVRHPYRYISICMGPVITLGQYSINGAYTTLYPGLGTSMLMQIPIDKSNIDFLAFRASYSSSKINEYSSGSMFPQYQSPPVKYVTDYTAMIGLFLSEEDAWGNAVDGRLLFGYRGSNVESKGFGFDLGLGFRFHIVHKVFINICLDVESLSLLYATGGLGYRF